MITDYNSKWNDDLVETYRKSSLTYICKDENKDDQNKVIINIDDFNNEWNKRAIALYERERVERIRIRQEKDLEEKESLFRKLMNRISLINRNLG